MAICLPMNTPPLQFVWRRRIVRLEAVPPTRTVLQLLREDLGATSTKEGCNQGDCGACVVVLGQVRGGTLHLTAVNACLCLAHALQGRALWTAQDIGGPGGQAHPLQLALHQHHASQCGFCTPGFAMSLFALYHTQVEAGVPVTRADAQRALSGNLCRCTGYRPILDAAQAMAQPPLQPLDRALVLSLLERLPQADQALEPDFSYQKPGNLQALLQARAAYPEAWLVAGGTDLGVRLNTQLEAPERLIDLSRVPELAQITPTDGGLRVGAAVALNEAFAALAQRHPGLDDYWARFAGLPVRNMATLGGNLGTASPIGDSLPVLLALQARITLQSLRGPRTLDLPDYFLGYRQTACAADEVIVHIEVPDPEPGQLLRAYKVSKRHEDDISAVSLVLCLILREGHIAQARIAAGGVAATPARARQTEAALQGQPWAPESLQRAVPVLQAEFSPLSDLRASSAYRRQVLGGLLRRFAHDTLGGAATDLHRLSPIAMEDVQA
ncbi:MAG: xanthine dehydrogenase small subunit [Rhodoferax sp.]